jgi:hypothetical protein
MKSRPSAPTRVETIAPNATRFKKDEEFRFYPVLMIADPLRRTCVPYNQHENINKDFDISNREGFRLQQSKQKGGGRTIEEIHQYLEKPEAFDEFMAGLRESYSDQEETLRSADQHLSKAVDLNPNFALAYAGLGYALACGGEPERGFGPAGGGERPRERYEARAGGLPPRAHANASFTWRG